ncbi:MAG: ABC transporter substrate-binding protein [Eubacteriaceae bacterium]|nr:ABC transporter substrate-binding protein [Eubacteriaceae bacterium]
MAVFLILSFTLMLCSCAVSDKNNNNKSYAFTDALGNKVTVSNPARVISLFGSFTETWVLAGGNVIATTDDAINERKMNLGSDVEIIGTVKAPDLEKIISLNPDFVILSADIASQVQAAETLKKAGINCAFFKVEHFTDYLNMLSILTDITGRKDLYKKNGLDIKEKIDSIISKTEKMANSPNVLYLRAYSTGVKSKGDDDMVGAMLKDLKAQNIASIYPSILENLNIEQIIIANPDYIFISTMGPESEAIDEAKKSILTNQALQGINAIKNNHIYILDKDHFHYKPNARWAESYEILYEDLYENK